MNNVVIFSKPNCPWCDRAKELAKRQGVSFTEIDLSQDQGAKDWIVAEGHKTVPQIYHDGVCIGGYEDFARYLQNQEVSAAG